MNHTLTLEQVQSIRRLAASDRPQRAIARQLGLSTTSVHRVLTGKWQPPVLPDDPLEQLKLQARRCLGCGGLVYEWPCRTCELRGRAVRLRMPPLPRRSRSAA
jgi:hypothetical protein